MGTSSKALLVQAHNEANRSRREEAFANVLGGDYTEM